MDWGMLGAIFAMLSLWSGIILWVTTRIENRLDTHMTETADRFDTMTARIDATGQRIDATGQRIDQTQSIIMRMLEKQGR